MTLQQANPLQPTAVALVSVMLLRRWRLIVELALTCCRFQNWSLYFKIAMHVQHLPNAGHDFGALAECFPDTVSHNHVKIPV